MKIREVVFNNFRSFRGEHRISFVNPVTQLVNPVTVLAGANGSGKTTLLSAIGEMLGYVLEPDKPGELIREAMSSDSFIGMEIELSTQDLGENGDSKVKDAQNPVTSLEFQTTETLYIAVGSRNLAPEAFESHQEHLVCDLRELAEQRGDARRAPRAWKPRRKFASIGKRLQNAVARMHKGEYQLMGGFLFFPHDRRLAAVSGGPIEPPPEDRRWRFQFSSDDRWMGSLEQFWVWQNYLDLEGGAPENTHLARFVDSVRHILGERRPIYIKQGRVWITPEYQLSESRNGAERFAGMPYTISGVRLDQLPSGEQQVLLLFGELARRRRLGAVIAIDEVENSLHPTLQRLAMWNLHEIARNWQAQVMVTTHSLEVIHTVRGSAFVNLDYPDNTFDLPLPDFQAELA